MRLSFRLNQSFALQSTQRDVQRHYRHLALEIAEDRIMLTGVYSTSAYDGVAPAARTELRGAMITPDVLVANYAPGHTNELKALGFNALRVELVNDPVGVIDLGDPKKSKIQTDAYFDWLGSEVAKIKGVLANIRQDGIGLIIDMHDPVGGPMWGDSGKHQLFSTSELANNFVSNWEYIAAAFKNDPEIIAFDLLNEPKVSAATKPSLDEFDNWNQLAARTATAIAHVGGENENRTFVIESVGANPDYLRKLHPEDFAGHNVAFSFHFYVPSDFTFFSINQQLNRDANPANDVTVNKNDKFFSKAVSDTIDRKLATVEQWQNKHPKSRLLVGEFGASLIPQNEDTGQSGSDFARKLAVANYFRHLVDTFERYRWDYIHHAYGEAEAWDIYKSFDDNRALWKQSSLKAKWAKNSPLFAGANLPSEEPRPTEAPVADTPPPEARPVAAPANTQVSNIGSASFQLSWAHNGENLGGVLVVVRREGHAWQTPFTLSAGARDLVVEAEYPGGPRLLADAAYEVQVVAVHSIGNQSAPSAVIALSTLQAVPHPPTSVVGYAAQTNSFKVSWDHDGAGVRGFDIFVRPQGGVWRLSESASPDRRNVTIERESKDGHSLASDVTYEVRVVAVAVNGASPAPSDPTQVRTLTAKPAAPIVKLESVGRDSFILTWKVPQNSAPITQYKVMISDDNVHYRLSENILNTERRATIEFESQNGRRLRRNTNYFAVLYAVNAFGQTAQLGDPISFRTDR